MLSDFFIPEPFLFNPLKHHLGFIKDFVNQRIDELSSDNRDITRELKRLGTSVMDVYTGALSISDICREINDLLKNRDLLKNDSFGNWVGKTVDSFRIISLSDGSQWTLKYHDSRFRFIHIFPSRNSQHTFRVKSNTLKSAITYNILIGKDLVTADDLNSIRPLIGLSPVKDSFDSEAILEMIEILR